MCFINVQHVRFVKPMHSKVLSITRTRNHCEYSSTLLRIHLRQCKDYWLLGASGAPDTLFQLNFSPLGLAKKVHSPQVTTQLPLKWVNLSTCVYLYVCKISSSSLLTNINIFLFFFAPFCFVLFKLFFFVLFKHFSSLLMKFLKILQYYVTLLTLFLFFLLSFYFLRNGAPG